MTEQTVKLYLIGAGPGDPGLITVRSADVLKQAECVIYDGLANPILLNYAPEDAELISVRKRTGEKPFTQQEIHELILQKAKQYKYIVRLKGGDPGFFGRVAEEVDLCLAHGFDFEIIPGITAALAAGDYCGMFLTDREHSSQVIFMTGREADGKEQSRLDFDLLARFEGSIVIYMGIGTLTETADKLISHKKASDTPVAVIADATTSRQRLLRTTLKNVADECQGQGITAPALVIIGPAANCDSRRNWSMNRLLFGQSILITRDSAGNAVFASKSLAEGAEPVVFDSIQITDLTSLKRVQDILPKLGEYDWIIFTSANGVRLTFSALNRQDRDSRIFVKAKIACIGQQTADCLREYGLISDFIPTEFTSKALADQLGRTYDLSGKRIVLMRSAIAPDDLPETLKKAGADVNDVPVYTVENQSDPIDDIKERLEAGLIHWITFTSSSTVRSLLNRLSTDIIRNSKAKIASIGPVVTDTLKKAGLEPTVEAPIHTIDGLLDAIKQYMKEHHD